MKTVALLLLIAASSASAEKLPVTLDVVARPPVSTDAIGPPAWSPDGRGFAYSSTKDLWYFEISSKRRRQLGSLSPLEKAAQKRSESEPFLWENRRVDEEKIQWTPDSKKLLLSVEGDLFLWALDTGKWEQLTSTPEVERNPMLSPDGRMVSFQRANDLHVLDLEARSVRKLTSGSTDTIWNARLDWVYPEELDLGTAHWWSPDSKRIAFLQFDVTKQVVYPHANLLGVEAVFEPQRYPKAGTPNADVRLGVVAATGGKVRWMELGAERDVLLARVDWLPDSNRIAVQRLNRVQNELTLLFADSSTGAAGIVLTERDPYWVNVSSDLRFLKKKNAFVWSSEKDGYRHLYLYDYDGRELQRLTQGAWEVKAIAAVDEAKGVVYFQGRLRSPLAVDVASVRLDGTGQRLVLSAAGQHSASFSPNADYLIDTYSSTTEPPRKTLHRVSGDRIDVLQPPSASADQYEFLKPETVQLKADNGDVLYARLLKPAKLDASRKYPAIVIVYGGPHAQSVCDCWTGFSWDQALAQRGYVVWQLDNRGTSGRGHAFETKLFRRLGKQELEDQELGIRHLISLGFVDASRIGMYGWSYGGFMTLYTLFNSPDLLRAGVAGAPVTDWRNYDTIYTERYLGLPSENEEGYRLSSPLHSAKNLKAALLIAHNYSDDNVLFQQSFQMMAELQKAGKPFETQIYPQHGHGVTGNLKKHLLEATTAFFDRSLRQ